MTSRFRFSVHRTLGAFVAAALTVSLSTVAAQAQNKDKMRQISTHMGEMAVDIGAEDIEIDDALRFEPYQQLDQMFFRNDVVYLMRHGPTDWSKLDVPNVAPTDCENQRIMSPEGMEHTRNLGTLLASNDILPSRIVVSQWCRNQQTVDNLLQGVARVDAAKAEAMPVETDGELNLLLSLQGAKNVSKLRERIAAWDGDPDRKGPLLVVSHYTNIEELTQFRVFEGEILVLDPKRDLQVLGYIRLRSARPDVGHFADALESPLNERQMSLNMVERYYRALNTSDNELLQEVLADRWVVHGMSPSLPAQDAEGFLEQIADLTDGLSDARFDVGNIYVADDVVTVIGTITGTHTGELFDMPATGREVEFGGIAVHKIKNGAIAESWQMADRLTLIEQISGAE